MALPAVSFQAVLKHLSTLMPSSEITSGSPGTCRIRMHDNRQVSVSACSMRGLLISNGQRILTTPEMSEEDIASQLVDAISTPTLRTTTPPSTPLPELLATAV